MTLASVDCCPPWAWAEVVAGTWVCTAEGEPVVDMMLVSEVFMRLTIYILTDSKPGNFTSNYPSC